MTLPQRAARFFPVLAVPAVIAAALIVRSTQSPSFKLHTFPEPIDALSIGVSADWIDLAVSANINGEWTPWIDLEIEKEFDPTLRESNLLTFGADVNEIRVRGGSTGYEIHPLRVSDVPASFQVAALAPQRRPKILTRRDWGADPNLLYGGEETTRSDEKNEEGDDNGGAKTGREIECEQWQAQYPEEFKTARTITQDGGGKLRWPLSYSKSVKLIAVHHTAEKTTGNDRDPIERMRLLYQYHAQNRGWGDVGYHYIIDEDGQIYEGRQGGDFVVAGHAYCSNVGTVGVALMGHFDEEQPTQGQMKALQWLTAELAKKYKIDLSADVTFHGQRMKPLVGHGNLVATSCPGYYVRETLGQVRQYAAAGRVAAIKFPAGKGATARRTGRDATLEDASKVSLTPAGSLDLVGRPGSQQRITLRLRAYDTPLNRRERVATVSRSNREIGVWQQGAAGDIRVREELILEERLPARGATTITLLVQLPLEEGTYTLTIDDIPYVLRAQGRAVSEGETSIVPRRIPSVGTTSSQRATRTGLAGLVPQRAASASSRPVTTGPNMRVRLGHDAATAIVLAGANATANGRAVSGDITLDKTQIGCRATVAGKEIASGIVRITSTSGIHTVKSKPAPANRFRGTIECQIVDGQLTIINELPLEDYMRGLAEEPDTEPYEKQRAFAIAARSYAAHYMQPHTRKFPGKPYDGDDSPARFQLYMGVYFEEHHPNWLKAVDSTSSLVVKKDNQIVKTPYFSSDSGRTKAPAEAGWPGFPFAEVFSSKPDPWCNGMAERGHGVGMSGCGSKGQALEGKTGEQILEYYYPGTKLERVN